MISIEDKLYKDFLAVNRIELVPMMLEVICRTTGMGFAAVARVTEDRWLACSVRDEAKFGLEAGGELQIETTICNEIRDHRQPVVIDHVAEDKQYADHHTPKFYGLQSYISYPIMLKDGSFFGTLCAIDAKPAQVSDPKIMGTFTLFSQLLTFHLDSLEVLEKSQRALADTSRELMYFKDESRQIRHISSHTLQEPLRKIRLFSDFLVTNTRLENLESAKDMAVRINNFALEISELIRELSEYSKLGDHDDKPEPMDLNKTVAFVSAQMDHLILEKKAILIQEPLPTIEAIPIQMAQLFAHLIGNALKFAKTDQTPLIKIYAREVTPDDLKNPLLAQGRGEYVEIVIEDTGIGIEPVAMDKIYDIFMRAAPKRVAEGFGAGLAFCRRIVHNHGGMISARSKVGEGTAFSVYLPVHLYSSKGEI
jgi:signal transduction histidine kinase